MKIDLRFNIYFVLWFVVICITFLIALILAINNAQEYYVYQKYLSDNEKQNIDWYIKCPDYYLKYQGECNKELRFRNITGCYCNGTLVFENSYKIK